jgi:hypothetical protein
LTLLDVDDEGVVLDMDTDDDYRRILAIFKAQQSRRGAGVKG